MAILWWLIGQIEKVVVVAGLQEYIMTNYTLATDITKQQVGNYSLSYSVIDFIAIPEIIV